MFSLLLFYFVQSLNAKISPLGMILLRKNFAAMNFFILKDKNSLKDFGMGVHPVKSGSVLAPVLAVPADGNVKAKRYTESVLDGYLYGGDW